MPDILIRGMEMPNGCNSCKLNDNGRGCSITGTKYETDTMVLMDFDEYKQRLKDCPLHELPEHGDLIEKQTALAALYSDYAYAAMDIIENEVPVIVPSNKEGSE